MIVNLFQFVFLSLFSLNFSSQQIVPLTYTEQDLVELLNQTKRSEEVAHAARVCWLRGSVDFGKFPVVNANTKLTREPRVLLFSESLYESISWTPDQAEYCSMQNRNGIDSEVVSEIVTDLVIIAIVELFAYAREKAARRAAKQ